MTNQPSQARTSRRLYRILLRLMPSRFRRVYGGEMQRLVQHMRHGAATPQKRSRVRFWARLTWDVLVNAILEHNAVAMRRVRRTDRTTNGSSDWSPMSTGHFWRDARHALRIFGRSPGFTLVSVVTLAIGVGANVAVFNAVQLVLLEPLPFQDADRLVRVFERRPHQDRMRNPVSLPDFVDWKAAETPALVDLAAFAYARGSLTGYGPPTALEGTKVSDGFFELFDVRPMLGRPFTPEEARPGGAPVLVLSHGIWERLFGRDSTILGRVVSLDGESRTIVGVMPRGFSYPFGMDYWAPLTDNPAESSRGNHSYRVVGRLTPDATVEEAFGQVNEVARRLAEAYPRTNEQHLANVVGLKEVEVGSTSFVLLFLLGAVALVLVIVCTNVAGMQLARGITRQRELAVRTSIGASRGRLIKQLLVESAILGLMGGIAGALVALLISQGLTPRMLEAAPWVSRTTLAPLPILFGVLSAVALTAGFGMIPALACSRVSFADTLREGSRSSTGVGKGRLRNALAVAEVALALTLMIGAALIGRSLARLLAVDPGFDASNVFSVNFELPLARYETSDRWRVFFDDIETQFAAVPGVERVGFTWLVPFSSADAGRNFMIDGRDHPSSADAVNAQIRIADSEYFRTMRIPLVAGRLFERATDRVDGPRVAVVNETMARTFWIEGAVLGARFRLGSSGPWTTIVGVVGDVTHTALDATPEPEFYLLYRQFAPPYGSLVVRTEADVVDLMPAIRSIVADIDPELPVSNVALMRDQIDRTIVQRRTAAGLVGAFGVVGLVLAAVGVYGVVSYTVGQRAHEIGVRLALGGRSTDVLSLFMMEGIRIVALGLAVGLGMAFLLSRALSSLLFGISATDTTSYVGAGAILVAISLFAVLLPAVRASRLDPVVTLRSD